MNTLMLLTLLLFQSPTSESVLTCSHYRLSEIWDTQVALYNPQRLPQTVTVAAYDEQGQAAGTVSWLVPAEGGLDGSLEDLFPDLQSDNGWFEIQDPSGLLQGNLTYAFDLTGATATVPFQRSHGLRQVVPLIENDGLWLSGVALTNLGQSQSDLMLTLKFADGRPADQATLSLAPGQKHVGMVSDFFDNVPARGKLVVDASQPVAVLAIGVGPAFLQLKAQNGEVVGNTLDRRVLDVAEVQGWWRRLGYGNMMNIEGNEVTMRRTIDGSCTTPFYVMPLEVLGFEMFVQEDGVLRVDMGFTEATHYYERITYQPETCEINLDPVANLEAFVSAFDQHFAFFPFLEYDWSAAVAEARARVTAETTQTELFDILVGLQAPTLDGHGDLVSDFDDEGPGMPGPFMLDVFEQFQDQNEVSDFGEFYVLQVGLWQEMLAGYVSDMKMTANEKIVWGRVNDHTGYLLVLESSGFSEDGIFDDGFALESALDEVFADLGDLPALIYDNRWNPGGVDVFSKRIASRFADQKRLAYSETGRYAAGFLPWRSHWITPHPTKPTYQGDVIYLTSSNTGSAAEIMTLMMRVLPNVTHLGERTSGALSDSLDVTLPNGWELTLSNEIYLDHEGEWFEYRGIPAALPMPHFPRADRESRRDSVLEKAIALTQP